MVKDNMETLYVYKKKNLANLNPNSVVAVKTDGDSFFSLYVTDKAGIPFPLKDITGGATIQSIVNTDGYLTITGGNNKTINVSASLLTLINNALQSGDNISELNNDSGYITLTDLPQTKLEFNTQLSDGDFLFVGDITQYTDTQAQNAVVVQTITDGDTTHAPSADVIFDTFATKEPTVTPSGLITDFWSGNKTWRDLATDVRNATLGVLTLAYIRITTSDTFQAMFGKLQGQIDTQMSTTWLSGSFTINALDSTKFDCNITGVIHNPVTNTNTFISKSDISQSFTYFPPTNVTYIGIDTSGSYVQQATRFTASQRRLLIGEWGLVYTGDGINLLAVNNYNQISNNVAQQVGDVLDSIGTRSLNGGCQFFASPITNLAVRHTGGSILGRGWGEGNLLDPHKKVITASVSDDVFQVRKSNGVITASTTLVDPTIWESPLGSTAILANPNDVTVHRFTIFQSGLVRSQIGQTVYNSIDEAIARTISGSDPYTTEVNISDAGCTTMFLAIQKNCTLWSQTTRYRFFVNPQTNGTSGTQFTPTFQSVYGASTTQPQVLIDDIRGSIQFQSNRVSDTLPIWEGKDTLGNVTSYINGDGSSSFGGDIILTVKNITLSDLTSQDITGFLTYLNALSPNLVIATNERVRYIVTDTFQIFDIEINGVTVGLGQTVVTSAQVTLLNKRSKNELYPNKFWHKSNGVSISDYGDNALTSTGTATNELIFGGGLSYAVRTTAATAGTSCALYQSSFGRKRADKGGYYMKEFFFNANGSTAFRCFSGMGQVGVIGNINPSVAGGSLYGLTADSGDTEYHFMYKVGIAAATRIPLTGWSKTGKKYFTEIQEHVKGTTETIVTIINHTDSLTYTAVLPFVFEGAQKIEVNNGTDNIAVAFGLGMDELNTEL